jgi:hypothetical protein
MTPTQLAEVHQHDKTGSLPIVSRALLECEARVARMEEALRPFTDIPLGPAGYCSLPLHIYVEAARAALRDGGSE